MPTICLVGPYSALESSISSHVRRLKDILEKAKISVTLVDTDGSSEVPDDVYVARDAVGLFKTLWSLDPAIVDFHLERIDPVTIISLLLLSTKHRILISIHGNSTYKPGFVASLFERLVLLRVRLVIVHDAATRDRIKRHTWKGRIMALPEYLPLVETPFEDDPDVMALRREHNRIIVASAPEIGIRHGGDVHGTGLMIETLQHLREELRMDIAVLFHVEKQTEEAAMIDLRKRIEEAGLNDHWAFVEGPTKSLRSLWAVADVFVRTGSAPLSRVIQRDAMSLGIPVVTHDGSEVEAGASAYHVGDGKNFRGVLTEVLNDLTKAKERLNVLPFKATPDRFVQMYRSLLLERTS